MRTRIRGKQDGLASGRCVFCHRLRYRVHQALRRINSSQEWGDVSGDSKASFCVEAANLFGDKLQKLVTSTLEEARTQKSVRDSGGAFKDDQDLQEKYKNKPEQLANIVAHAPKYFCPVRKVTLRQDPEYVLTQQDLLEQTRKQTREVQEDDKIRPTKKSESSAQEKSGRGQ